MKRLKPVIKTVLFAAVLAFLLNAISGVLVRPGDQSAFRNMEGFYEQKRNTLDAVYIGSSRVYAFWNPVYAYARSGMTVYSLATAAQSIEVARYLAEEVHKTQPGAVLIVNLESMHDGPDARLNRVLDKMPASVNKLRLAWDTGVKDGDRILDRIENLFPLNRYHTRWQELEEEDFTYEADQYKSSSRYDSFLGGHLDVKEAYRKATEHAIEPDERSKEAVDSLLDYCKKESIPVIFTLAPQAGITDTQMRERTGLKNYILDLGGTVLDFQNMADEMMLDFSRDYDNGRHTNIHGSFKFTAYLADLLTERFGFTDKRGTKGYEDWDTALLSYHELTDPYVLPFEWQHPEKRADLPTVEAECGIRAEGGVSIAFTPVDGSDGYAVFRKTDVAAPWEPLGDCEENTFTDAEGKQGCIYAVVAYTESDAGRLYGMLDYAGIEVC